MSAYAKILLIAIAATVIAVLGVFAGPKLVSHLMWKYLRRRRIAWWALLAVALCTTMVLVVISVMGGWLDMFEHSFQGLTGDIVVESRNDSLVGFPYYQEMIERMVKQPGIAAAVPTIHTFGIINIESQYTMGVQVMGLPIETIGKVNRFPESLYRQYNKFVDQAKAATTQAERDALMKQAEEAKANASFRLPLPPEVYRMGWNGRGQDPASRPGMIPGSGVLGIHRNKEGKTVNRDEELYTYRVQLTTIAIRPGESRIDPNDKSESIYWIVDDSHTGLWQYDNTFVYVPFDRLQNDLMMSASKVTMSDGREVTQPARASDIHIRVQPGYDLEKAKEEVVAAVSQVMVEHRDDPASMLPGMSVPPTIQTWREKQHVWIDAITNEKLLTVFLFAIISVVAIFLVFCIFYMIVMEKTKDIGIIKSVGATSSGVAAIFLGYGLAIGLVGSLLGLLCSFLIVHYINELHAQLGKWAGIQIWDPQVYLFDKIPNTMSWRDIVIIVPIAIISSVLGALIPAIRAARMHPVESLRWE
jgi:lipoprotein-releasing system permease protein